MWHRSPRNQNVRQNRTGSQEVSSRPQDALAPHWSLNQEPFSKQVLFRMTPGSDGNAWLSRLCCSHGWPYDVILAHEIQTEVSWWSSKKACESRVDLFVSLDVNSIFIPSSNPPTSTLPPAADTPLPSLE